MSYLGANPAYGLFSTDYFSGNGTTTTFNLTKNTGNEASIMVSIFGITQQARTYTLNNGQLIFSQAPPNGTNNIEVRYLGERVMVNPALSADPYGIVRINSNVLTTNTNIGLGYNASSTGPIQIANNIVVSIASGSVWKII